MRRELSLPLPVMENTVMKEIMKMLSVPRSIKYMVSMWKLPLEDCILQIMAIIAFDMWIWKQVLSGPCAAMEKGAIPVITVYAMLPD